MATWITLSVVALLPMLLHAPQAFTPLRVDPKDPSRFAGFFRRFIIHIFTGRASGVTQRGDSITKGSISSTMNADLTATASVTGSISTEVVVTDTFFLTDAQGRAESFQVTGFNAALSDGHIVSVAWAIRKHRKSGPYFLVYNHTTRSAYFNKKSIAKSIVFRYPTPYVALLCLMLLPFPVVMIYGIAAEYFQIPAFRRRGVRPLIAAFEANAAALPTQTAQASQQLAAAAAQASPSGHQLTAGLKELIDMRDSGALSEAEFESAKTKLLAPQ